MNATSRAVVRRLFALWLCLWCGCSFSDERNHCASDADCASGQTCVLRFCVRDESAGSRDGGGEVSHPTGGGGGTGAEGATSPSDTPIGSKTNPASAVDSGMQPSAAADASMTAHDGADAAPRDAGTTTDASATSPACSDGDTRACTVSNATGNTPCSAGTQICNSGSFGTCIPAATPLAETCNGIDDDCDGKTDEQSAVSCYPSTQIGCTLPSEGGEPTCTGLCVAGQRACQDGSLGPCTGATTPAAESCDTSTDEDCDGKTDEDCACVGSESRSCYPGAINTQDVGPCRAGTQTCANGVLGDCIGAVVPQPESCANPGTDDNCDGQVDNIKDLGAACSVAGAQGVCKNGTLQCQAGSATPVCVGPKPGVELCNGMDDNCDGAVDDGFDLQTDPMHCGACEIACAAGEACCAGHCTNLNNDANNCGACGAAHACADGVSCCAGSCCGATETCCAGSCTDTKTDPDHCGSCTEACSGAAATCCDGTCSDLTSDQHCGMCGRACSALGDMCTCQPSDAGVDCATPTHELCPSMP